MLWTVQENEGRSPDEKALAAYKPTGDFWEDARQATEAAGVMLHPAL